MLHRRKLTRQMEMFRELSSGLNTQIIGRGEADRSNIFSWERALLR